MIVALIALLVLIICFSFVLLFGAPYLPTKRAQIDQAIGLLNLKPGDKLLELGAGTGGLTIAAASSGLVVTAYELNPILYLYLKLRTIKYRKNVQIRIGNFWKANFSGYQGVYAFLLDSFMVRLDAKMVKEADKGTLLASYTFKVPGKKALKSSGPVYLYKY